MRKTTVATALLAAFACPSPSYAWGVSAHRYIMRRAIELLPPAIKPFFDANRDELVVRVVDPDLWRSAGWEDDPNHFVDFGVKEYGEYPFRELPREYGAAIEKFGMATLRRNGLLPWREAEEFGNLRRAMLSFDRDATFARLETVLFAASAAHYVQDAHQPLHATNNYDGQLTGQQGVHSRFETALFDRYESKLTIVPPPVKPIAAPRDAAFDVLLESYRLVDAVLAADKAAVAGKDEYDDDYFDKFFAGVKSILERRLGESISATAGLIVGAWERAGKPELKLQSTRPAQKVRKPGGGGAGW